MKKLKRALSKAGVTLAPILDALDKDVHLKIEFSITDPKEKKDDKQA